MISSLAGGKDVRAEWPVSGEQCKYGQQGGYTSVSKHYYTRISLTDSKGTDAGVVTLVGSTSLSFFVCFFGTPLTRLISALSRLPN
jgi:hypothetical protein